MEGAWRASFVWNENLGVGIWENNTGMALEATIWNLTTTHLDSHYD